MDFSDKWFRKRFRDDLLRTTWNTGGESELEGHKRVAAYLIEHGVTLSSSGKMAYDRNLKVNNCSNLPWWSRQKFMDWARSGAPEVIKKRGAKPAAPKPPNRQPPDPPKTTGWDDFDWSK